MHLNTYLNFDGNCKEAFEFYRSAFGGEFESFMTFGDAPPDMPIAEEVKHLVMHVSLPVGPSVLMGSDIVEGFGPPTVFGNNFSITISVSSKDEADEMFAKLSDGGSVVMPLENMFWGAYFGAVCDKFGVNWQINHDLIQH